MPLTASIPLLTHYAVVVESEGLKKPLSTVSSKLSPGPEPAGGSILTPVLVHPQLRRPRRRYKHDVFNSNCTDASFSPPLATGASEAV